MVILSRTIQATVTTTLFALWSLPTPQPAIEGYATYMRPGLMAQVAANKAIDIEAYHGFVALNRAGDLGRVVWLQWEDGTIDGPLLVIDCAQRGKHYAQRMHQQRVAEVDYDLAKLRGFAGVGPVPVVVWFQKPPALWATNLPSLPPCGGD